MIDYEQREAYHSVLTLQINIEGVQQNYVTHESLLRHICQNLDTVIVYRDTGRNITSLIIFPISTHPLFSWKVIFPNRNWINHQIPYTKFCYSSTNAPSNQRYYTNSRPIPEDLSRARRSIHLYTFDL